MIWRKMLAGAVVVLGLLVLDSCGNGNEDAQASPAPEASAKASAKPEPVEAPAAPSARRDGDIAWVSLDDAQKSSASAGKPVYFHFYTDWCGYCKKMDKETFRDSKVIAYLNQNYLSVKINPEKSPDGQVLSKKFGVRGFPANGFSTDGSTPLGIIPGFLPPEMFLPILKYVGEGAYETMSLEDYMKKQ